MGINEFSEWAANNKVPKNTIENCFIVELSAVSRQNIGSSLVLGAFFMNDS